MNPDESYWDWDITSASLNGGNVFHDSLEGIDIGPIIEFNDSSITFNIDFI